MFQIKLLQSRATPVASRTPGLPLPTGFTCQRLKLNGHHAVSVQTVAVRATLPADGVTKSLIDSLPKKKREGYKLIRAYEQQGKGATGFTKTVYHYSRGASEQGGGKRKKGTNNNRNGKRTGQKEPAMITATQARQMFALSDEESEELT